MRVLDNNDREFIRIHRELQACSGCFCFGSCQSCMQQATVASPPGQIIGTVEQQGSASSMKYTLKDVNNQSILTIIGPCCIVNGPYSCGCQNTYTIRKTLFERLNS
ncbi:unnamed protein product [Rotaria sordida]|nr:unnamed protein product [Rotaria sordida]